MSAPTCARCGNPAERLLGAGYDLAVQGYTTWLDRKIAAGEAAQARIKTIAADQRGRPRDRATRNTTRYGNVAQRLHDLRTARDVWREWGAS